MLKDKLKASEATVERLSKDKEVLAREVEEVIRDSQTIKEVAAQTDSSLR